MTAHGDVSLRIGERVRASFRSFGARELPYFVAADSAEGK